ncbi:MAG: DNA repair protein RecN [Opitutales bacterium]
MLQHLSIRNLALIEQAELDFDRGLVTVTGETGAGKSVLLGALSLAAGNRAGKSVIRQGADLCAVEAVLYLRDSRRLDSVLERLELPACEEGALILRRELHAQKAGRVTVNGRAAPLSSLRELGEHWIDFHGPGEPQKLFHEGTQLELLDLFAVHGDVMGNYDVAYRAWRETLAAAEALKHAEKLDPDEETFLRSQLDAIEAVDLDEAKLDELERDFNRLDSSRELRETAGALAFGLSGSDRGVGAAASKLLRQAKDLAELDPEAEPLASRVEALVIEADDLAGDYRALADAVDFDEVQANDIQARMARWLEVKRRFGPELAQVLAKRDHLRGRLLSQGDIEARLHELEKTAKRQRAEAAELAAEITAKRKGAADTLARKARELLKRLGFKKPRLEIAIEPTADLTADGDSRCRFLFSPNPGQDLMPLNQIASSGETARVMLALKATLAEVDATPVLVFDEVDANVGGEIGAEVGRELARLGGELQVFCVTLLPQVAACGQSHWLVEKLQDEARTDVALRPIHGDRTQREAELARMLGDRKSASAKAHARELLGA